MYFKCPITSYHCSAGVEPRAACVKGSALVTLSATHNIFLTPQVHTVERYTASRRNTGLRQATTWMNLEVTMPEDISHSQKHKCCMIPYLRSMWHNCIHTGGKQNGDFGRLSCRNFGNSCLRWVLLIVNFVGFKATMRAYLWLCL